MRNPQCFPAHNDKYFQRIGLQPYPPRQSIRDYVIKNLITYDRTMDLPNPINIPPVNITAESEDRSSFNASQDSTSNLNANGGSTVTHIDNSTHNTTTTNPSKKTFVNWSIVVSVLCDLLLGVWLTHSGQSWGSTEHEKNRDYTDRQLATSQANIDKVLKKYVEEIKTNTDLAIKNSQKNNEEVNRQAMGIELRRLLDTYLVNGANEISMADRIAIESLYQCYLELGGNHDIPPRMEAFENKIKQGAIMIK